MTLHPLAANEQTIAAVVVDQHEAVAVPLYHRMVLRYPIAAEHDVVIVSAADGGSVQYQLTLLEQRVAHENPQVGHLLGTFPARAQAGDNTTWANGIVSRQAPAVRPSSIIVIQPKGLLLTKSAAPGPSEGG